MKTVIKQASTQKQFDEEFDSEVTNKDRKAIQGFGHRNGKDFFKMIGTPEGMKNCRQVISFCDANSKDRYHSLYQLIGDLAFNMWNSGSTYGTQSTTNRELMNLGFVEGFRKAWKKQYGDDLLYGKDMDVALRAAGADSDTVKGPSLYR